METYKITYKQRFNGKVLTESYLKTVRSYGEIVQAENALYTDPHVFWVESEKID